MLECVLKKDIQYTKANPKFHHWNTDEKRYGLTFERSDDAKAFDHGVRHAVADLTEGGHNCQLSRFYILKCYSLFCFQDFKKTIKV